MQPGLNHGLIMMQIFAGFDDQKDFSRTQQKRKQLPNSSDVHGSLLVMIKKSGQAYHEFEPCATEDPSCRKRRCILNLSRFNCPHVEVVWSLREGGVRSGFVT
ncbi:hypothetical protein TNCV_3518551 [Trichonephila clavipes]|uniref:Uncharacterized protein n=1 Tax=Trichonephila clavipes TaxID=2585209 RepID=A0A8X6STK7_TRICX|nr:hypothetical protein TNCV_3518551 [Trichonephila clavipes]